MTRTAQAVGMETGRSLLVAALIGIGVMAAVDEIVFHQILHWHHFYDRSTSDAALVSDGFLHAAELVILVAAFFLFADLRRRDALAPRHAWAGLLVGLGGFQLLDGIVNHKVFNLHEIRYDVDLLPYDLAWNVGGAVVLLVGVALLVRARRTEPGPPAGEAAVARSAR